MPVRVTVVPAGPEVGAKVVIVGGPVTVKIVEVKVAIVPESDEPTAQAWSASVQATP